MKDKETLVYIKNITLLSDDVSKQAVILKEDKKAVRQLAIYVGQAEFNSIAIEKGLFKSERPFTHEFYMEILKKTPIEFERIEIFNMKNDVFYARVIFTYKDKVHTIDSRPSDALALALNRKIPIMVNAELLHAIPSEKDMKEYKSYIKRAVF
jgi:bifunctional DNase/RNase